MYNYYMMSVFLHPHLTEQCDKDLFANMHIILLINTGHTPTMIWMMNSSLFLFSDHPLTINFGIWKNSTKEFYRINTINVNLARYNIIVVNNIPHCYILICEYTFYSWATSSSFPCLCSEWVPNKAKYRQEERFSH